MLALTIVKEGAAPWIMEASDISMFDEIRHFSTTAVHVALSALTRVSGMVVCG
jgi:hypothetical protein